jgi:hypothetical protein
MKVYVVLRDRRRGLLMQRRVVGASLGGPPPPTCATLARPAWASTWSPFSSSYYQAVPLSATDGAAQSPAGGSSQEREHVQEMELLVAAAGGDPDPDPKTNTCDSRRSSQPPSAGGGQGAAQKPLDVYLAVVYSEGLFLSSEDVVSAHDTRQAAARHGEDVLVFTCPLPPPMPPPTHHP